MRTSTTHFDAELQERLRGPSLAERASQLKWLLAFAQQDIGGLQKSEWKEVEEGLQRFCGACAPFSLSQMWKNYPIVPEATLCAKWKRGRLYITLSRGEWETMHRMLNDALESLYPKQFQSAGGCLTRWPLPVAIKKIELAGRVSNIPKRSINRRVVGTVVRAHIHRCYEVGWPDLFWFAFAEYMETFASALRRCTECQTLYVKQKRQEYCSKTCSQRVRTRRWKEKDPLHASNSRHRAYVRYKRKQLGLDKVKPQRRGPRIHR
ncbi:MAG: hypothetical protein ABIU05_24165 [Nitrospirales bacterium]